MSRPFRWCCLSVAHGLLWAAGLSAEAGSEPTPPSAPQPPESVSEQEMRGSQARALELSKQGDVHWRAGRRLQAMKVYEEALRLRRLDPDSPYLPPLLRAMGTLAEQMGDYVLAEEYLEMSIRASEPGSLNLARGLAARCYLQVTLWQLSAARRSCEEGHEILETIGESGGHLARSHAILGHVTRFSGDLDGAESHYLRALEIYERLGDGATAGLHLGNLGNLARQRRDYETALPLYRQALARLDESTSATYRSRVLSSLGRTLLMLGRADEAAPYLERSLAEKRAISDESPDVAASRMLLGDLERTRGNEETARSLYRQALALHTKLIPGSPAEAENQTRLAQLEALTGDIATAEALLRSAIRTLESRAPDTAATAAALHQLARLRRAAGDRKQALDLYRRATRALDGQWQTLGGSTDERLAWMTEFSDAYRELLDLLVEAGLGDEAWSVLQRFRARVLRDILSGRRWQTRDDPRVAELESQLLELSRRRQELLDEPPDTYAERTPALGELSAERVRLLAELRETAPDRARLERPESVGVDQASAELAAGTALVSYSVGPDATVVFVLHSTESGRLRRVTARLDVSRAELRERVEAFREVVQRHDATEFAELNVMSSALYEQLLRPVEELLEDADHLLLAVDGPLHRLPFAALRRQGRYLVEWKPLHLVPSLATYAELRQRGSTSGARSAVFGDPGIPGSESRAADGPAAGLRSVTSLSELKPLPFARREIGKVRRHLPRPVNVYLGADATEARMKRLANERIVHFAGHALLDERAPLQSALVLGAGGSAGSDAAENNSTENNAAENGLLYAWEIIEEMRLGADLVTLSACDTALGREAGGEGLLGLTWAFHHAGARSVVASQWSVEDRSTAELMGLFYRGLEAGLPKDEALRRAQLALFRGTRSDPSSEPPGDDTRGVGGLVARDAPQTELYTREEPEALDEPPFRHPYYWSAFQLYGLSSP